MELQDRQYIETKLLGIQDALGGLRWISPHILQASSVAHFGCSIGAQTIALSWLLGSSEVVGLDIKENAVVQARSELESLRRSISQTSNLVTAYSDQIPEAELLWWADAVPPFFKDVLVGDDLEITFVDQDITKSIPLLSRHYDLSFADFVLHHIWYDEGGPGLSDLTSTAIGEMVRITAHGGFIAARELVQMDERPLLDFEPLFRGLDLERIHLEEVGSGEGTTCEYIYRIPNRR